METNATISRAELANQLSSIGVAAGDVLLVHTSYSAARPIEGGPTGLIDALLEALGPGGTLVMPTMTDGEAIFDPRATPTLDMGITAELFWRRDGVSRSTHPGGSFAATGPHASMICAPQPLAPPHGLDSPVGRVHDLDGKVLLIGVHHSESTTIHLAEALAKVPYSVSHPCVIAGEGGEPTTIMIPETDHCCENFRAIGPLLHARGEQSSGDVGHAPSILARSRDVVACAMQQLAYNPLFFLCPRHTGCVECDRAHASIEEP